MGDSELTDICRRAVRRVRTEGYATIVALAVVWFRAWLSIGDGRAFPTPTDEMVAVGIAMAGPVQIGCKTDEVVDVVKNGGVVWVWPCQFCRFARAGKTLIVHGTRLTYAK